MHGEIITIGDELISGRILDLNSRYAAGRLTASGLCVTRINSVGDDYNTISEAITKALNRSRFVIITGGLGSTNDDMTSKIVARALNRSLCLNQQMLQKIKTYADARRIRMTPSLEKMAWVPEGSRMLTPKETAACGFFLKEKDARLYFLPGVPEQMRYVMDEFVIPDILSIYKTVPVIKQKTLKLYGLDEPSIAEIFQELHGKTGEAIFGFYPHFPENHITISLRGKNESNVTKKLEEIETQIRRLIGPYIFGTGNQRMEDVVGQMLTERNLTISLAESCTGGLICHRLTNVPGSSRYFHGGAIVYSNQSKVDFVHVSPRTLEMHGAVSDSTVCEMASGIKKYMKADLGLAVTGIAGPAGGTDEKPVGTVHLGLADRNQVFSGKYGFSGNRRQIKLNTSMMALDWVRRYLNGDSLLPGI